MGTRVAAIACVVLTACRPATIDLEYRFREGSTITYAMTAVAEASWEIGGRRGRGSYRAAFEVEERITTAGPGGAIVEVVMRPTEIVENGLPSPGEDVRTFTLRLGVRGEVVRVLEANGVVAADLEPEEAAFIGTFRPPLPADPIGLRDEWTIRHHPGTQAALQQLVGVGTLAELGRDRDGAHATITSRGRGPVVWVSELPQGRATITGDATTSGRATIGIDDGLVRDGTATVGGTFNVRVLPTETVASPIAGTFELELEVTVHRQEVS